MKNNIIIRIVIMTILNLSASFYLFAQNSNTFELIENALENIHYSSLDIGDYDNDGYNDIVISGAIDTDGDGNADQSILYVYKNVDGTFKKVECEDLVGMHLGAVKFIDIDNDGDLDFIATGQNYNNIVKHPLKIYENKNGEFVIKVDLQGCIYSSIDCGDYNNDGYQDFIISGIGIISEDETAEFFNIYQNDGTGNFISIDNNITPVVKGSVKFMDVNNDGKLDIVTMGYINDFESMTFKVYLNEDDSFVENQEITEGFSSCWFEIADFNNDGYEDIIVMGQDTAFKNYMYIYLNEEGTFIKDENNSFIGISSSNTTNTIATGDYNNNGYFDFIALGSDEDYNEKTLLYNNDNGVFTLAENNLENLGLCTSTTWIDIDNDNDLDLIISGYHYKDELYQASTLLYRNNTTNVNQKPEPPEMLSYTLSDSDYTFHWSNGSDDITPVEALNYWITVGTEEGKGDIASYKVHGNTWTIKNITEDIIYWSVQTIDGAGIKSEKKSDIIGLSIKDNNTDNETLNIYPNPAKDIITISNIDVNNIKEINIFDNNGRVIINSKYQPEINVEQLPKGIYVIEIIQNNNCKISDKFIKN